MSVELAQLISDSIAAGLVLGLVGPLIGIPLGLVIAWLQGREDGGKGGRA